MQRRQTLSLVLLACCLLPAARAAAQGLGPAEPPMVSIPRNLKPTVEMPTGKPPVMPDASAPSTLTLRLGKAEAFPAAGLKLTLPLGFVAEPLSDPYQILQASRNEGMHKAASLAISVYPVEATTTPESLIKTFTDELHENIGIRRLKIEPAPALTFAGQTAMAQRLSYRFGGIKTVGLVACFVRTFDGEAGQVPPGPLAYLVTFEVLDSYSANLDELVSVIGKAAELTDLVAPATLNVDTKGPYRRDYEAGFAMRQPAGWAAQFNEAGLAMGRMNYLLGDVISPSMQVLATTVPDTETARTCGEKTIELERELGWDIEIVSAEPAKLAGRDAWQIVLRKRMSADYTPPVDDEDEDETSDAPELSDAAKAAREKALSASSIEVRRFMCMPDDEPGRKKHFALILTCHECSPRGASNLMDAFAGGFAIQPKPADYEDPGEGSLPGNDTPVRIQLPR